MSEMYDWDEMVDLFPDEPLRRPAVEFCPKCRRKSLETDPATGRVWCLYAADCGYGREKP